jgi:formylglycine-generating enzyme required for sulfatase activity
MLENYPICTIPAGRYPIGDNSIAVSRPVHTVQLAAFAIGQTVVTNLHFLAFINGGGYQTEACWTEMGWRWYQSKQDGQPGFWRDPQFNNPDQPVVGVSWYEADAFARWLATTTGQPWRLPSEAEWEAAARGPEAEAPLPRRYNTAEYRLGHPWAVTTPTNIAWCGAADLVGNVWEWCSSRWGRNWQTLEYDYPYSEGNNREDPNGSYARIMRGGSWFDPLKEANPANRARYLPGSRASNIGFRLAQQLA